MRASAATLLLIGALLLFSPSPATSETLDLDADDVPSDTDKAAPADFTIPVKINGEQVWLARARARARAPPRLAGETRRARVP